MAVFRARDWASDFDETTETSSAGVTKHTYVRKTNTGIRIFTGVFTLGFTETNLFSHNEERYEFYYGNTYLGSTENQAAVTAYTNGVAFFRQGHFQEAQKWFNAAYFTCKKDYNEESKFQSSREAARIAYEGYTLYTGRSYTDAKRKFEEAYNKTSVTEIKNVLQNYITAASEGEAAAEREVAAQRAAATQRAFAARVAAERQAAARVAAEREAAAKRAAAARVAAEREAAAKRAAAARATAERQAAAMVAAEREASAKRAAAARAAAEREATARITVEREAAAKRAAAARAAAEREATARIATEREAAAKREAAAFELEAALAESEKDAAAFELDAARAVSELEAALVESEKVAATFELEAARAASELEAALAESEKQATTSELEAARAALELEAALAESEKEATMSELEAARAALELEAVLAESEKEAATFELEAAIAASELEAALADSEKEAATFELEATLAASECEAAKREAAKTEAAIAESQQVATENIKSEREAAERDTLAREDVGRVALERFTAVRTATAQCGRDEEQTALNTTVSSDQQSPDRTLEDEALTLNLAGLLLHDEGQYKEAANKIDLAIRLYVQAGAKFNEAARIKTLDVIFNSYVILIDTFIGIKAYDQAEVTINQARGHFHDTASNHTFKKIQERINRNTYLSGNLNEYLRKVEHSEPQIVENEDWSSSDK